MKNYYKYSVNIAGNYITIDFSDNYITSFTFTNISIIIKNLYLTFDHRLNSNKKYYYDLSNQDIDYDYMQSGLTASFTYRNSNYTIEKQRLVFDTTYYKIRNASVVTNDPTSNFKNFTLEFSENNYSSTVNAMSFSGNITFGRYWNTLSLKFEIRSTKSYEDQIFYGFTLKQKKTFMNVNSDYFPPKNQSEDNFTKSFCQYSNERSSLLSWKSISCNFIGNLSDPSLNYTLLNYYCIYCEYENDQQLNIHFINDEQQINETTFYNASINLNFSLVIVGVQFYGNSIVQDFFGEFQLQTTFLTSFIYTKNYYFKKYMDYDYLMKTSIYHDTSSTFDGLQNYSITANSDSFYPKYICNYTITLNFINNTVSSDTIYLYFSNNFDLSSFQLLPSIGNFTQINPFNIIKITTNKINQTNSSFVFKIIFTTTNPPFDANDSSIMEMFLSIKNKLPPTRISLNQTRNFFNLSQSYFNVSVIDALQYSDYEIGFNYSSEYTLYNLSKIILVMEGYFNLTYFRKNITNNTLSVDIYKNNQKLPSNFSFYIVFGLNLKFIINLPPKLYLSYGFYRVILINMINSYQNRPSFINLILCDERDKLFVNQTRILQNISKNPNMLKKLGSLFVSNPSFNQLSNYIFSIHLQNKSVPYYIFRIIFPMTTNFIDFRDKLNPKFINITINFPNNPEIPNKIYQIISGFSKIEFQMAYDPLFSSMNVIPLNITMVLKNPYKLTENIQFLFDVYDPSSHFIIQQIIFKKLEYNFAYFDFNASILEFETIKSFAYVDFLIAFNISQEIDFNFTKIMFEFPSEFNKNSFKSANISFEDKGMEIIKYPAKKLYYNETSFTLEIHSNISINFDFYLLKLSNVLTPLIINDQFCLNISLSSIENYRISNITQVCSKNLIPFNQSFQIFNTILKTSENNYNATTIYQFVINLNYSLYKYSEFYINFNNNDSLSNLPFYIDCSLENAIINFSSTLKCYQNQNKTIVIIKDFLDKDYILSSQSGFQIILSLFRIKNPLQALNSTIDISLRLFSNYSPIFNQSLSIKFVNKTNYSRSDTFYSKPSNHAETSVLYLPLNFTSISEQENLNQIKLTHNYVDLNLELISTKAIQFVYLVGLCSIFNQYTTKMLSCYYDFIFNRIIINNVNLNYLLNNSGGIYQLGIGYVINFIYDSLNSNYIFYYKLLVKIGQSLIYIKDFKENEKDYQPVNLIDLISIYPATMTKCKNAVYTKYVFDLNVIFNLNRPWCGRCQHTLFISYPKYFDFTYATCLLRGLNLDSSKANNYIKCNNSLTFNGLNLVMFEGTFQNYVMKNKLIIVIQNLSYLYYPNLQNRYSDGLDLYIFDSNMRIIQRTFKFYTQNYYLEFSENEISEHC